ICWCFCCGSTNSCAAGTSQVHRRYIAGTSMCSGYINRHADARCVCRLLPMIVPAGAHVCAFRKRGDLFCSVANSQLAVRQHGRYVSTVFTLNFRLSTLDRSSHSAGAHVCAFRKRGGIVFISTPKRTRHRCRVCSAVFTLNFRLSILDCSSHSAGAPCLRLPQTWGNCFYLNSQADAPQVPCVLC